MAEPTIPNNPTVNAPPVPVEQVPIPAPTPSAQPAPDLPPSRPVVADQDTPTVNPVDQHHSMIGRAFRAMVGSPIEYTMGPDGKPVATEVPQKPGDIFRHILAGAIIGGAVGPQGNFATGFSRGADAVKQNAQQQDLLKRQQAQEQFKNQQAIAQRNMEQQRLGIEQQRLDNEKNVQAAQIGELNARKIGIYETIRGESLKTHQALAEDDKPLLDTMRLSGLQPSIQNVGETEKEKMQAADPAGTKFLFAAKGVRPVTLADGTKTFENYFDAYEPKKDLEASPAILKQFEKDGMEGYQGYEKNPSKFVTNMPASKLISLLQADAPLHARVMDRQLQDLKLKETQATIDKFEADAKKLTAESERDKEQYGKQKRVEGAMSVFATDIRGGMSREDAMKKLAATTDPLTLQATLKPTIDELQKSEEGAWKTYEALLAKDFAGQNGHPNAETSAAAQRAMEAHNDSQQALNLVRLLPAQKQEFDPKLRAQTVLSNPQINGDKAKAYAAVDAGVSRGLFTAEQAAQIKREIGPVSTQPTDPLGYVESGQKSREVIANAIGSVARKTIAPVPEGAQGPPVF